MPENHLIVLIVMHQSGWNTREAKHHLSVQPGLDPLFYLSPLLYKFFGGGVFLMANKQLEDWDFKSQELSKNINIFQNLHNFSTRMQTIVTLWVVL